MESAAEQLYELQKYINSQNRLDLYPNLDLQRLAITPVGEQFHLDFYGSDYEDLLYTVADPDVAPYVRSLILRGPDQGANGTNNWNIEPLVETDICFPNLIEFSVQLNQPQNHNRSIIARDHEEEGVLAKLLRKAPVLQTLIAPSAPNIDFFNIGIHPLKDLSIDAGWDTQDFILNLAKSPCFPELHYLEWGEFNETYLDDYLAYCTPKEHYTELFQSEAFLSVCYFVWRNPIHTDDEIKMLKKLRPTLQLKVIRSSGYWVN